MSASEKRRTVTLNPCYENPLLTQTNFGRSSRRFPNQRETFHNKNILNWQKSYKARISQLSLVSSKKNPFLWKALFGQNRITVSQKLTAHSASRVRVNVVFNYSRKKACRHDGLPPSILKDSAIIVSKPLTHVINSILQTGIVPEDFKHCSSPSIRLPGRKRVAIVHTVRLSKEMQHWTSSHLTFRQDKRKYGQRLHDWCYIYRSQ